MNTSTTPTTKMLPPFAAKIEFKSNSLFQGKHKFWTFRSDDLSYFNAPAHVQFGNIEKLVLEQYRYDYFCATIFDNRFKGYIPYGEERPKNNIILQAFNGGAVKIDKRRELDLSFLHHEYDRFYLKFLAEQFQTEKYEIDLKATMLSDALKDYKQALNL